MSEWRKRRRNPYKLPGTPARLVGDVWSDVRQDIFYSIHDTLIRKKGPHRPRVGGAMTGQLHNTIDRNTTQRVVWDAPSAAARTGSINQ
jgi:hypothetical protein